MSSIWDGEDTIEGLILLLAPLGSINWGLVEFADYNAVDELAAAVSTPVVATAVYALVAIAGVIALADIMGVYDVDEVVESLGGGS